MDPNEETEEGYTSENYLDLVLGELFGEEKKEANDH